MGEEIVAEAWWVPLIGTVATAVVGLIGYFIRKLINRIVKKMDMDDAEREAVQALLAGMAKAQDEVVREAKKAAADGKLTKEEIKTARLTAISHAREVATGPAKELLLSWGEDRLDSLIKQLLAKFKKPKVEDVSGASGNG